MLIGVSELIAKTWQIYRANRGTLVPYIASFFLPPVALFLAGLDNFIAIISLAGGVFLGLDVTLMILVYLKAKKQGDLKPAYSLNLSRFLIYALILFFALGAIYEVWYFVV